MKFERKVLRFTDLMTSGLHGAIFPMENSVLKNFSNLQDIISHKVTMELNI